MWRTARLDPDGTLAPEINARFNDALAHAPVAEASILDRLKQRLCSDEQLADQLQSGNVEANAEIADELIGLLAPVVI